MFNLESLNDYEFELLCKDIMERILHIKLYTFAKGPDGGIDICDKDVRPKYMIQVKHYNKSSFSALKNELKKEVNKVENKSPKHYYVCTSQELTKKNKNEIYDLFSTYMNDTSNIIDKVFIDDFLSVEENQEIVRKNYKLWLCASNVLSLIQNQKVFIDCDELLIDIENNAKFFVETRAYNEALKKLNEERIIIITGGPGVGKSTLSKMLVLKHAAEKYAVRYTSDNEIGNIKDTLSIDSKAKEIVLLDDFLGQHYLKIKDNKPNEIKSLISFIKRNPNKKIILNSRITILNEAKQHYISFKELLETYEHNTYLINLNNMSDIEKAKILYNHIFFNELPRKHYLSIKNKKSYLKIINHKNYNPRIIEYVTKERVYRTVQANEYFDFILKKLNEPKDVWKDEFDNRLNENDRVLMYTLYSLTNTSIEMDILEKSFNKRIREEKYDTSVNIFQQTITRLTNSLVVIIDDKRKVKISVINPSINDYINTELKENINEQLRIIKRAIYIEQILKVANSEEAEDYIKNLIISGDMLKLKSLEKSIFFYYVQFVYNYKIKDICIEEKMKLSFERIYEGVKEIDRYEYGSLINKLINYTNFITYYHLEDTLNDSDKVRLIFEYVPLDDLKEITEELFYEEIIKDNPNVISSLKEIFIDKIINSACEKVDNNLSEIISSSVHRIDKDEIDDYFRNGISSYFEDVVWDDVSDALYEEIKEVIPEFNTIINLSLDDFDIDNSRWYFDLDSGIDSYFGSEPDDDREDWYERGGYSSSNVIEEMFER